MYFNEFCVELKANIFLLNIGHHSQWFRYMIWSDVPGQTQPQIVDYWLIINDIQSIWPASAVSILVLINYRQ